MAHELPVRGAPWFRVRRVPGFLGVVGPSRLLVFQIILVSLFFLVIQRPWAAIVGGVVGVVAIVVTFGRSGGRWWTERALLWLRYRRRKGAVDDQSEDSRLVVLRELVPDLVVEDVEGNDDARFGMGGDGAGWFAALEVEIADDTGAQPPLPLAALAGIAADAEQSGVVVQVVCHANPGLDASAGERRHTLWVVVRLDAYAIAESVIDEPDTDVDVPAVLREIIRRVGRALRRRGLRSAVLDNDALTDALLRSTDLVPGARTGTVSENWDRWRSSRLSHGCFWLKSWPDIERGPGLLAAVREYPAELVSIAIQLEPRHERTDIRCLIRIAEPDSRYQRACDGLVQLAQGRGGELLRLDGEHALATYSSAPAGGGAR